VDGGWHGREPPEGGDICILIADSQQKLTQHCKAIILKFKTNPEKKKKNLKFLGPYLKLNH